METGEIMARSNIEEKTEILVNRMLEGTGIEVAGVEYVRERDWILRIFIDKEGGVDLNDCQKVSEEAGELLDKEDLIPTNYMLEVSSPGLDRVLKKKRDFIRYTGQNVDVKLFAPIAGKKEFTARLEGLDEEGRLLLRGEDGNRMTLEQEKTAQVRLHFSFD